MDFLGGKSPPTIPRPPPASNPVPETINPGRDGAAESAPRFDVHTLLRLPRGIFSAQHVKRHRSEPTWSPENEEGHWRAFEYDEVAKRDKLNLDLRWLRDTPLPDSENLPERGVEAAEIVEDLPAALEAFPAIAEERESTGGDIRCGRAARNVAGERGLCRRLARAGAKHRLPRLAPTTGPLENADGGVFRAAGGGVSRAPGPAERPRTFPDCGQLSTG